MNYTIIHGIQGYAGKHWMGWLSDELQAKGHNVQMPTFPNPDKPDRKTWSKTLAELSKGIDPEELVLVTHSLGAPTALDFLESHNRKIHGLIAVAGFYEVLNSELNDYFMKEKIIDLDKVKMHLDSAVCIYGNDDPYVPQEKLNNLAKGLNAKEIIIPNGGHINTDAGFTEAPVILEEALRLAS